MSHWNAVVFCIGILGYLTKICICSEEHACDCNKKFASYEQRLQALEKLTQQNVPSTEQYASIVPKSDNTIEPKSTTKRFVVEMDMEQEIIALIQAVSALQKQGSGSTYVRWGKTSCPTSAVMVYSGYTGGNHYSNTGGPGNHLCLPEDPTWASYVDGDIGHESTIYGTEYEDPSGAFNPFHKHFDNEDAPCALCKTNRTSTIMIPARTNCYNGWTMEYTGYLMSSASVYHASSEYICVDGQPEFTIHGHGNDEGALLYFFQGMCGSLPCGPYVNGRELACVVCSQ